MRACLFFKESKNTVRNFDVIRASLTERYFENSEKFLNESDLVYPI